MSEQIYVELLDEGITVWRPVKASRISGDTYVIDPSQAYNPDDEKWEFPPGSKVVVERRKTSDGEIIAAVRLAEQKRRTA